MALRGLEAPFAPRIPLLLSSILGLTSCSPSLYQCRWYRTCKVRYLVPCARNTDAWDSAERFTLPAFVQLLPHVQPSDLLTWMQSCSNCSNISEDVFMAGVYDEYWHVRGEFMIISEWASYITHRIVVATWHHGIMINIERWLFWSVLDIWGDLNVWRSSLMLRNGSWTVGG